MALKDGVQNIRFPGPEPSEILKKLAAATATAAAVAAAAAPGSKTPWP